jgi:hypothetical protein
VAVTAGQKQKGTAQTQPDKYAVPARVGVAVAGVLLCIVAAVAMFLQRTTSVVTEVQTNPTSVAATLAPTPSPAPALSPPTSAAPAPSTGGADSVKTTTTVQPGSDALVLGILGVGALLLLAACFFERVTKLSFLGAGVELASVISGPSAAAVEQVIAATPSAMVGTPEARGTRAAAATNLVMARATQLALLGKHSPPLLYSVAAAQGLPQDEIDELVSTGKPSAKLLERLAKTALSEVTRNASP